MGKGRGQKISGFPPTRVHGRKQSLKSLFRRQENMSNSTFMTPSVSTKWNNSRLRFLSNETLGNGEYNKRERERGKSTWGNFCLDVRKYPYKPLFLYFPSHLSSCNGKGMDGLMGLRNVRVKFNLSFDLCAYRLWRKKTK